MKRALPLSMLVAVILLAVAVIGEAQQPMKTSQIGYLNGGFFSGIASRIEAFRQGLLGI